MRHERRAILFGALATLLLARALRALFSTAFYESLATLRLNGTAFWLLVLLSPLLAHRRALLPSIAVLGLASAALPLARFTPTYLPIAALASAAGLLALASALSRPGVGAGLMVGLALDGALLLLGHSHDLAQNAWGTAGALAATGAMVALALRADGEPPPSRSSVAGLALAGLLAVQFAFLASPFALARWMDIAPWLVGLAGLTGLAIGASALPRVGRWLVIAGALGLLDVAFVGSPLRVLSLAAIQLALGAAGARLAATARPAAFGLAFAPLAFVLLYFREPIGVPEWGAIVPTLALVALLVAAWRAGRAGMPRPIALGLPVLVVALCLVASLPAPLAKAPEGRDLVVVAYNVHQGFGNRRALDPQIYADILRPLDADIILLQESDTARLSSGGLDIARYLAHELGMHAAVGQSDSAVLARVPMRVVSQTFWSFEVALEVNGTTVYVESTHLARRASERTEQAAALVAREGTPRILGGDFNFFGGLASSPYGAITERYQDAWVASGHAADDPAGSTHSAPNPARRVDIIFVDGLDVVNARPILDATTRLASDHLPVEAKLRLRAN